MKSRKISLTGSPDGLFVKLVGPSPLGPPTTPQKISSVKKNPFSQLNVSLKE